jgi:Ca2+-binding EF-hand superfamily protein
MSSISGISGISSSYLTSSSTAKRPDPTQLADDIFSKLDTKNQGYIDKSDLQSALDSLSASGSSTTASSNTSSSADALFSQLDANGDGKVTQSEMESGMQKLANALDSQAMGSRMHHHHHHGGGVSASTNADQTQTDGTTPPTQNVGGLTQDQLTSIATKLSADPSSANSHRAQFVNDVANNFSKADANGDGKVSFQEAIAYEKSTKAASASAGTSSDSSSGNNSSSTTQETQARMMHQLMQLIQAYGNGSQDAQAATQSASPSSSILAVV